MKGPAGFQRLTLFGMNLVLCFFISVIMLWVIQSQNPDAPILTPAAVLLSFVTSFVVGYTWADLVPAFNWGLKIAQATGLIKSKIATHIVLSITLGVVMGVGIAFLCSFITNFGTQGWAGVMAFFTAMLPYILGSAIILVVIFLIPIQAAAKAISGFDPAAAQSPQGPG
ncbi:MAG: hypothetical protein LBS10_01485 [Gracilibacteraceae bacterium]|jgi:hypothetical protein|nr:hypothetical protein [Gracilibacteraceae bacterium]